MVELSIVTPLGLHSSGISDSGSVALRHVAAAIPTDLLVGFGFFPCHKGGKS